MEQPMYHLYLSTHNCVESHAICICYSPELAKIRTAIWNVMEAFLVKYRHMWWYNETYALEKANEFAMQCEHMLDKDAKVEKKKYPFYDIGFIVTNLAMFPDNKGGYEKDFCK